MQVAERRHLHESARFFELLLQELLDAAEHEELTFGGFLERMNHRGLPAVMLVPTLLMLMPFGLFPGSNALIGVIMAFVAAHIALGRKQLWLPGRLRQARMSGRLVRKGLAKLLPLARWLDAHTGRRLALLAEGRLAHHLAGVIMTLLSLVAVAAGLIPGIPTIVSLVVLLLALGLLLRDGVVLAVGYAATALSVWAIIALWPGS